MSKKAFSLLLIPFLLFYAFPAEAAEKEERSWQDESIYFIMVDRFNNGDNSNDYDVDYDDPRAYKGGDIQGIIDKLDYIKELGSTAIWLTPVMDNEEKGYHGYWIEDFYKVDEHFGTMEDMKRLVKEAHKRDMKVMLDMVVNHTGYEHEWLSDPDKQDWFHDEMTISNWQNQEQVENGWLAGLPDLNTENPEVKEYLIDMAKWWIEETDVDGYRLDTVKHVPKPFWEEFSKEMRTVKEDFFLMGEVWHKDPRYVADYEDTGIHSFVNYPFYEEAVRVFSEPDTKVEGMYNTWKHTETFFDHPYLQANFLDNHDNERFVRKASLKKHNPETRLKLALTYLYAAPGIPILYQGTEIAMDGGPDPDNRRLMDFRSNTQYADNVKRLGQMRQDMPSLRRGTFELLHSDGGMAVFKREYEGETSVLAVNNSTKTQSVTLGNDQLPEGMELQGVVEDDLVRGDETGYNIIMDREKANVYLLKEKSGLNIPFISMLVIIYSLFIFFIIIALKKRKKARA